MKPTTTKSSDTTKSSEKSERPTATDTLCSIAEIVLRWRGESDKPTLAAVARVTNKASGLLRIKDLDERMETEHAATVALAKKYGLMS